MLRAWNHTLHAEPIDGGRSRYSDTVEIDAGRLTPVVGSAPGGSSATASAAGTASSASSSRHVARPAGPVGGRTRSTTLDPRRRLARRRPPS